MGNFYTIFVQIGRRFNRWVADYNRPINRRRYWPINRPTNRNQSYTTTNTNGLWNKYMCLYEYSTYDSQQSTSSNKTYFSYFRAKIYHFDRQYWRFEFFSYNISIGLLTFNQEDSSCHSRLEFCWSYTKSNQFLVAWKKCIWRQSL